MIEIILSIVAIVGCLAFVFAIFKMIRTPTTKTRRKTKKTKAKKKKLGKTKVSDVPKEWRKETKDNPAPTSRFKFPQIKGPEKIRVPGLRLAKRILAGILTLINFFVMCSTLMSHPTIQPLFWLFAFNFFILMDYMWKTGRGKIE